MDRHEIRLYGQKLRGDRIPGDIMAALFPPLDQGARQAVRFALEGRSHAPRGNRLDAFAAFDFLPTSIPQSGLCVIHVADAPLREHDPTLAQLPLFDPVHVGDKSAIGLLEDFLELALQDPEDSDFYDHDLLKTFLKLGKVFSLGVERLEIVNGRTVPFTEMDRRRMEALAQQTPPPQHLRVAGKLETLGYSSRRFTLELVDGQKLTGIAEGIPEEELRTLWGKNAVMEGTAYFKPSGRLRRIEATSIGPARDADLATFSAEPVPVFDESPVSKLTRPTPAGNWLDEIWGKWPGDETDEEVYRLIEELS